ncbi:MAG: ZIP family metal transporter [Paludibacteraceae bacterium]|nr:ZIP family metal transporter [Paludibacteraceae bacterium]
METAIYSILSVVAVSLASLCGIVLSWLSRKTFERLLFVMVSFAIGTMLGSVLFDLLPEAYEGISSIAQVGWLFFLGFGLFFLMENLHFHHPNEQVKNGRRGYMNLIADGLHNFTDGVLIATSWMISHEIGLVTTMAILLHEIPQELGDYAVLIRIGFAHRKALLFNFVSALMALSGCLLTLLFAETMQTLSVYFLPFAAGGFVYLSLFALLPLLLRGQRFGRNVLQLLIMLCGMVLMYFLAE